MMVEISATLDAQVGTSLWLTWADIAIAQAKLARASREQVAIEYAASGKVPDAFGDELPASMVTVAGVVACLEGFSGEAGSKLGLPPLDGDMKDHERVWVRLSAGFDVGTYQNAWQSELKLWFGLRHGVVHPVATFKPPAEHPVIPGVSHVRALYTCELAERSVEFMKLTLRRRVRSAPTSS